MLLGSRLLEVNAINQSGLTALDLLLMFSSEAGDREIQEILCNAGAMRTKDVTLSSIPSSPEPFNQTLVNSTPGTPQACTPRTDDLVEYFKFNKGRDSPGETRTALLVIAVLVATATFQVGVNPPVGFSLSLHMINMLTIKFPLQFELQICMAAMFFTYNTAVTALAPDNLWLFLTVVTSSLPAIMPLIAKSVRKYAKRARNPLHVASAYNGHIDFVKEITRLRLDFAKELNEDGFSPMHMASANGYLEIVRELMKVDRKLSCGECLEDVTVQRDTAMHLAIKNYQFEVIRVMVDWIREMKKEYVLNMKDDHGNTALHLATWKKQRQASSFSLQGILYGVPWTQLHLAYSCFSTQLGLHCLKFPLQFELQICMVAMFTTYGIAVCGRAFEKAGKSCSEFDPQRKSAATLISLALL
ncbi:hypothetical protein EZV62_019755 [Acer yangbiense]|uniref:Uncharacterized protein n=1 Tax=Acer yangbiense TaxID=1000413 RepID=A0A5C7HC97_9ROSI|nr:hypothetical protein EZV62_019755 [Acer yangbiense]